MKLGLRSLCRWVPVVAVFLLLAASVPPAARAAPGLEAALARGAAALQKVEVREDYSPWIAVTLRAAGYEPRTGVDAFVEGLAPDGPTTDYALALLAVLAEDGPTAPAVDELARRLAASRQADGKFADCIDGSGTELVNAHVWAMIALGASGTAMPAPERACDWLAARQHPDGGFSYGTDVEDSDVDMTAMALLAFAALDCVDDPAVDRALRYLAGVQSEVTGGFGGWGLETTADSSAVVIQSLVALGLNPTGPEWTKRAGNPVTAVLALQGNDGCFSYAAGFDANLFSTRSAVLALADLQAGTPFWERLAVSDHVADVPAGGPTAGTLTPAGPAWLVVMVTGALTPAPRMPAAWLLFLEECVGH
ncbi:MAG: hypothetical protein IBX71_04825 [Candidatus Desulforudis sp.]|nr:hypothetical protein [Desulforudis sp.]